MKDEQEEFSKDIATLKQLLFLKIDGLEKLTQSKFEMQEQALFLQTKETERRLDGLNGEAGRLQAIQATYLPREVYSANQLRVDIKFDDISKQINIAHGISKGIGISWNVIVIVLGFIISVAIYIFH
jgi:hypothetical protein